jgi:hypothetical protein
MSSHHAPPAVTAAEATSVMEEAITTKLLTPDQTNHNLYHGTITHDATPYVFSPKTKDGIVQFLCDPTNYASYIALLSATYKVVREKLAESEARLREHEEELKRFTEDKENHPTR